LLAYITPEVSGAENKFLFPWGPRSAPPAGDPRGEQIYGKFNTPVPPFKFCGPIFCQDMGPVGLCHAEKFQRSLTPKEGDIGGQNFFLPLPLQNSLVKPPQSCVIMSTFVSPTNPENLVKVCRPDFFVSPLENMGLLNILESGVNS